MPKWIKVLVSLIVFVGFLLGLLGYVGRNAILGTQLKYSEKESVRYAGNATEADARKVGDALKEAGYFNGNHEKDVIIRRDDKGVSISFVVGNNWNNEEVLQGLRQLGKYVGTKALSLPITVRLLDPKLKTLQEFKVE